jgi:DNA adenine methylase
MILDNMNAAQIPDHEPLDLATRPLLKWAGGKTQLLPELLAKTPKKFGKYIEPFFGGGALFFSLRPAGGVIADSNPELVNLYRAVADSVEDVIDRLRSCANTEEAFYVMRALDWTKMTPVDAAARTIFLNRTCFNGLYRVNKSGGFNVPFGRYKNPKILDEDSLRAAAALLGKTKIVLGDYKDVLNEHAAPGDFVFLDPPYLPVSKYADFKRYTKEQFYEEDHHELAQEVGRLQQMGCHVLLTNSNHPLVHELFGQYKLEVIQTKRYISCNGGSRKGEDVIVSIAPRARLNLKLLPPPLPVQVSNYPSTRYMGSKAKLLSEIWGVASQFNFDRAVDLFAGSGVVGYMFKSQGKAVVSNDYMAFSNVFAKAMLENNSETLSADEAQELLLPKHKPDNFVEKTFAGLYFTDDENRLIDTLRVNIARISSPYVRSIAMSALIRACFKKRPRGIFTYVGHRYDDGRKDLSMTFEAQFLEAVDAINGAVFSNGKSHKAIHGDAMSADSVDGGLVYIDPPYYSQLSDNEYVRRYHFVEGLARNWEGVEIQQHTLTKKFKSYPTPFSSRKGAADAFDILFKRHRGSIILVSYSSNSLPTLDEMVSLLSKHKSRVEVLPMDYKYSFGNQAHKVGTNKNTVQEYLFIGY